MSAQSSLYENNVLITKPFQANSSGKKLPTLFSMKRGQGDYIVGANNDLRLFFSKVLETLEVYHHTSKVPRTLLKKVSNGYFLSLLHRRNYVLMRLPAAAHSLKTTFLGRPEKKNLTWEEMTKLQILLQIIYYIGNQFISLKCHKG